MLVIKISDEQFEELINLYDKDKFIIENESNDEESFIVELKEQYKNITNK